MDPVIVLFAAVILTVVFLVYIFLQRSVASGEKREGDNEGAEAAPAPRRAVPVAGVGPAGGRRRVHRNRMVARPQPEENEEPDNDIYDDIAQPEGKVGAKKMKKLQDKAERKAAYEAELQEREERKERQEQQDKIQKRLDNKEKAEEAAREEEERLIKEEEEKKEYEEYLKLKEAFVVEEEGEEALSDDQATSLLRDFLDYIKGMKVVMLEDLAAKFKIKTQDAIDRVRDLIESGDLSGVLDDRGKFIYITQEEYEAVAKFIRQRGRVSISELAESSNKLINLTPDNQALHKKLMGQEVESS